MIQPTVTLTLDDIYDGAIVGVKRHIQSHFEIGRKDSHNARDDKGWEYNIGGSIGEKVVAKYTGRPWDGALGNLDADDVGSCQVRSTPYHDGFLRMHKTDKDHKAYILVTGIGPVFTLRGWLWGIEGKLEQYWGNLPGIKGRPAYWIPQSHLREIKFAKGWNIPTQAD